MRESRTVRYECLGGPRDGDVVEVSRQAGWTTLSGEHYYVGSMIRQSAEGEVVWTAKCLVWLGYNP